MLEQAGTELGQAQLKLGLDFTLIFCRIGYVWFFTFLKFCLVDSVCSVGLVNLVLSQRKQNCILSLVNWAWLLVKSYQLSKPKSDFDQNRLVKLVE